MHKVLVFKETLLPASETFILSQMKALSKYVPILAGLERAHPSLPLPRAPPVVQALTLDLRRPSQALSQDGNRAAVSFEGKALSARPCARTFC